MTVILLFDLSLVLNRFSQSANHINYNTYDSYLMRFTGWLVDMAL